jgi:hypothetical protein
MRVGVKKTILSIYDAITVLFTLLYMPIVKVIKKYGVHFFPLNRAVFLKSGIYPIQDHYYEPQFIFSEKFDAAKIRKLNIDLHESEQLEALKEVLHTRRNWNRFHGKNNQGMSHLIIMRTDLLRKVMQIFII